jgi:tRNA 5-methylaminomethyl-2-thiouridine biosynthesis bifunctional protein
MKIEAATLSLDANGTPWSAAYGDVYHSADSGPGQARHVFLGGNDLPANWARRTGFTIVETGFGLGINFLATWRAWRDDPARPARLNFVSIEKHPFSRDDLQTLHRKYEEFADLAPLLHAAWPLPLAGTHRLHFDDARVTLTLIFDDIAHALPQLRAGADAFYLDGFSPQKNADMWAPRSLRALARLARPDATLATYTTARAVKDALTEAGFVIERRRGFGSKRDMLAAHYRPHWQPRHTPPAPPQWPRRHAIVIGAGIAGAAVAGALARRGWSLELIERAAAPATAASGMHAGAFHPLITRDDSITARLTRAGFLYALRHWQSLEADGQALAWQRCGLLQLAANAGDEARMHNIIAACGIPPDFAQYLDRTGASARAGIALASGGWWFPQGGWLRAPALVAAELAAANAARGLRTHFNTEVVQLRHVDDEWQALAADGSVIASAPLVVLANADDAGRLVDFAHPLRRIRGQVAYLPAAGAPATQMVLTGSGYLLPAIDGVAVTGTSYDLDDDDPAPHAAGYDGIAAQLQQMLGGDVATAINDGRVGFRCVAVDRLPLVGAVADLAAARAQAPALTGAQPAALPRLPGLYAATAYGSRGLVWSALAAELIACLVEGEPLPLEADLVDAIDPARFVLKLARHGAL